MIIFLLHFPPVLFAQTNNNDSGKKWSLQDCFDYANKNNLQLQTLRKSVELNQQDLLQAKGALLPSLSVSSTQFLTHSKNNTQATGESQKPSNFASNYSVNSNVTLYQGGFIKKNIQSKQLLITSADLTVQQTVNEITIQITQAYLSILLDKESIIAFQNVVHTSQAQYDNSQILFDAGSIAKKDLVQMKATLATDKYNLVIAQNLLRLNTLTLKQILELPSSYDFQVRDPGNISVPLDVTNLQDVEDSALLNRPEIKFSANALQQSNLQLKQAYSKFYPTLSAGGSLESGYSDNPNVRYLGQLNDNFYQQLGITVSIPIFSNRINKTNVEKSKIEIDQSVLALKSAKLGLSQEVEQAYINVLNAQGQYAAAQVQFIANEENYRIANAQLALGAVDLVGFLVQKNLFIQAQQALIQAKYNVILYHGIYEFYRGRPITL